MEIMLVEGEEAGRRPEIGAFELQKRDDPRVSKAFSNRFWHVWHRSEIRVFKVKTVIVDNPDHYYRLDFVHVVHVSHGNIPWMIDFLAYYSKSLLFQTIDT